MKTKENAVTGTRRRITLQNLLAEGSEIWVKNRSGQKTGKEAGNIVMQVGSGNMIDKVIIPPGNDPVCLTDQVTPKMLEDCSDLFKLVRSGALELLDPKDAETYYEQNKARKQIVEDKIQKFLTNERVPAKDNSKPESKDSARNEVVSINPKVGDICLKARHGALSEREVMEVLFEQESVLNENDYGYLTNNGHYAGVKKWANEQLNRVQTSGK